MFFMAGMPWFWIAALGVAGVSGAFAAYTMFPHVATRIDRFLTGEGDTFQVDMGREALIHGGWFGVGPGEGTVKRVIPDSHADFVFAVAGLVIVFGFQSIINMAVNLQLMPAKGMTLPFISYGGSSLLGMAFGMGLVLALGRKRFGERSSVPELNVSYAR
jgi:cell division protein FtsW